MKNIFFSILFLGLKLTYAQQLEFKFDIYTVYNKINLFSNSSNQEYTMNLYKENDNFYSVIIDLKNNYKHFFNVKKINNEYTFTYIESRVINFNLSYPNYYLQFTTINEFENRKTVDLKCFKNKRMKKVNFHFELELEKNENNLFYAFRKSIMHPYEYYKNLDINENYIVKKATLVNNNKRIEYNLEFYEKLNLTIIIPKIINENI